MQVSPRRYSVAMLAGLIFLTSFCHAGWFGGRKKSEETLIVTGNYLKSRMLAELIQYHTKHPILLLPSGDEPDTMYFIPNNKESLTISSEQYVEFVETFHPKTVVFLGNESYAPVEYEEMIQEGLVISTFRNDDWQAMAESVGKVMKIRRLARDYKKYLGKYDYKGRVIDEKPVKKVMQEWKGGQVDGTESTEEVAK